MIRMIRVLTTLTTKIWSLLMLELIQENCITPPVHGNDKLTKHLELIQRNRKISLKESKIYSETVASTGRPNKIKRGKPSSFYESYYAKTNSNNLRSTKRGQGIG